MSAEELAANRKESRLSCYVGLAVAGVYVGVQVSHNVLAVVKFPVALVVVFSMYQLVVGIRGEIMPEDKKR